jgi:hypothetical protein
MSSLYCTQFNFPIPSKILYCTLQITLGTNPLANTHPHPHNKKIPRTPALGESTPTLGTIVKNLIFLAFAAEYYNCFFHFSIYYVATLAIIHKEI